MTIGGQKRSCSLSESSPEEENTIARGQKRPCPSQDASPDQDKTYSDNTDDEIEVVTPTGKCQQGISGGSPEPSPNNKPASTTYAGVVKTSRPRKDTTAAATRQQRLAPAPKPELAEFPVIIKPASVRAVCSLRRSSWWWSTGSWGSPQQARGRASSGPSRSSWRTWTSQTTSAFSPTSSKMHRRSFVGLQQKLRRLDSRSTLGRPRPWELTTNRIIRCDHTRRTSRRLTSLSTWAV